MIDLMQVLLPINQSSGVVAFIAFAVLARVKYRLGSSERANRDWLKQHEETKVCNDLEREASGLRLNAVVCYVVIGVSVTFWIATQLVMTFQIWG